MPPACKACMGLGILRNDDNGEREECFACGGTGSELPWAKPGEVTWYTGPDPETPIGSQDLEELGWTKVGFISEDGFEMTRDDLDDDPFSSMGHKGADFDGHVEGDKVYIHPRQNGKTARALAFEESMRDTGISWLNSQEKITVPEPLNMQIPSFVERHLNLKVDQWQQEIIDLLFPSSTEAETLKHRLNMRWRDHCDPGVPAKARKYIRGNPEPTHKAIVNGMAGVIWGTKTLPNGDVSFDFTPRAQPWDTHYYL